LNGWNYWNDWNEPLSMEVVIRAPALHLSRGICQLLFTVPEIAARYGGRVQTSVEISLDGSGEIRRTDHNNDTSARFFS
jgi:hypothetical protein